jgi:hypothetical protein
MLDYRYSQFDIAHECCQELINAQPSKDKLSYKKLLIEDLGIAPAKEAFSGQPPIQGAGRSRLVEVLYKDIISKSNVDFGTIPQSRGDITRYQYYKTMSDSISSLNQLVGERANESMVRMNELHEAIIAERAAFEFGYKINIDIIQFVYCTMVEALMDVINENIVLYVDYLKETQNVDLPSKPIPAKNSRVDKSVDTFLNLRKRGEWAKLVDYYKKQYQKRFFAEAFVIGTVTIVGFVALLWAIRTLIYTYFYSAVKVDEKAKAMSNYLTAVAANETNPNARRKQEVAYTRLNNISAFIESRILKDESRISKELQQSDASISKSALMSVNQLPKETDDSGYEFNF